MHSHMTLNNYPTKPGCVLILVVMEDALAHKTVARNFKAIISLNPCCNGRCTRTRSNGYNRLFTQTS